MWTQLAWQKHMQEHGGVVINISSVGGLGTMITALVSKRVGSSGSVVLSDINEAMLTVGRQRLEDRGIVGNIEYSLANAEKLPFADGEFDAVTIAFGLRNVTDQDAALREMLRVLKPGGRAMILEFSKVEFEGLRKIYDGYSFEILPRPTRPCASGKWENRTS